MKVEWEKKYWTASVADVTEHIEFEIEWMDSSAKSSGSMFIICRFII